MIRYQNEYPGDSDAETMEMIEQAIVVGNKRLYG